jgi:hypothetical protein
MHLALKKETKPAASNFLQQQAKFDEFIEIVPNSPSSRLLLVPLRVLPCSLPSGTSFLIPVPYLPLFNGLRAK